VGIIAGEGFSVKNAVFLCRQQRLCVLPVLMTGELFIGFKVAFGQSCPIHRARIPIYAFFAFAAKQQTQQVAIPDHPVIPQYLSKHVLVHRVTFHLIIHNLNAIPSTAAES
jgi:hypothetical protein